MPADDVHELLAQAVPRRHAGDYREAEKVIIRVLAASRQSAYQRCEADALTELGVVQSMTGAVSKALLNLDCALAIYRHLEIGPGEARALCMIGQAKHLAGDYSSAFPYFTQSLDVCLANNDRSGEATARIYLGIAHYRTGEYAAASANQERALDLCRDLGNRLSEANALHFDGVVRLVTGEAVGDRVGHAEALNRLGTVLRSTRRPGDARVRFSAALELSRATGCRLEEGRAVEGIGHCLALAGDTEAAVDHLNRALAMYVRIGVPDARRVMADLPRIARLSARPGHGRLKPGEPE